MARFLGARSVWILLALAMTPSAFAGTVVIIQQPHVLPLSTNENKSRLQTIFSLGVQWDFGSSRPQVVAGVRRTQTNTNDHVWGGKVDLALPLTADFLQAPTFRIMAVGGNRTFQGEAGVGLTVGPNGMVPLLAAGAQAPFVNGGANYVFGSGLSPYLGVNSIERAPGARQGQITCPAGYSATNEPVDIKQAYAQNAVLNGYTCALISPPPSP